MKPFINFCLSFTISDGQAFLNSKVEKIMNYIVKHPTLIFQLPFQMLLDLLEKIYITTFRMIGRNLYIEQEKLFLGSPAKNCFIKGLP